ncbi:hypothetical protein T484DRAFT_1904547 [Baffinella frigidus]|nr:hypothetical protein T484DRAFT_1904547 [Cryptophyta sp. CCMP2293]
MRAALSAVRPRHASRIAPESWHAARRMSAGPGGRDGIFVSDHFELRPGTVDDMLSRNGFETRRGSEGWLQLRSCPDPVCKGSQRQKWSKNDMGNQYTFGGSPAGAAGGLLGTFHCFRCEAKGNWFDFKAKVEGRPISVHGVENMAPAGRQESARPRPAYAARAVVVEEEDPDEQFRAFLQYATGAAGGEEEDDPDEQFPAFLQYATGASPPGKIVLERCVPAVEWLTKTRRIKMETLLAYKVGMETLLAYKVGVAQYRFRGRDLISVTFPWFNDSETLPVRVKARALEDKKPP